MTRPVFSEAQKLAAVIETRTRQLMERTNPPDTTLGGAFVDMCEVSVRAFKQAPDAELASNPAAGPLVRYLLHAMRSYLVADPDGTKESREALHRAFGVEAIKRGTAPAKPAGELALCEEYRRALVRAVDAMGKMKPNAHGLAIKAMFEKKHGRRPINDGGDKSKIRAFEALLAKHGYTITEAQRQYIRRQLAPDAEEAPDADPTALAQRGADPSGS